MSELRRLRMELNNLKTQVKHLLTKKGDEVKTLGQVISATESGKLTVALYASGTTDELTTPVWHPEINEGTGGYVNELTGEFQDKEPTKTVTAYSEVQGLTALAVGRWVKCYQNGGVWYVNNLDWTVPGEDALGSGAKVDFIVDNFDRADSNDLGAYWAVTAGGFQLKDSKAISATEGIASRTLEITASGTETGGQDESETIPYFSTTQPSVLVGHSSPLNKGAELHIRVQMRAPTSGKKALGVGLSYNGLNTGGGLVAEETYVVAANLPPVTLSPIAGTLSNTAEYPWTVRHRDDTKFCDANGNLGFTAGPEIFTHGTEYETATATAGGLDYSYAGGLFLGFRSENAASSSTQEIIDLHVAQVGDVISDTATVAEEREVLSVTALDAFVDTGILTVGIDRFEYHPNSTITCANGIWARATGFSTYLDTSVTAAVSANYRSSDPQLQTRHSNQATDMEVHLVVTVNQADVYIDGVLSHTTPTVAVNPFGLVGMLSILNNVAELTDGADVGITQFKAWVGVVEPNGAESGHGDIGAAGVLEYKDGYHSTDSEGVVTYDPNALDF